ncbi:MAG: hypothetical protein ABL995_12995 [Bryobacteraceae bacterium]
MNWLRNKPAWRATFSVFLALALLASCLPCLSAQTQASHQCCPHHEKSSKSESHASTQSDCALSAVDLLSLERPNTLANAALAPAEFVVLAESFIVSSFVPAFVPMDASLGDPLLPLVLRV